MDRNIEVKVGGSHLTKDSRCAGVRGEANVTRLKITFDEGWDNYAKTVTFWDARGGNPVKVLLTTALLENISRSTRIYLVPIPAEPMAEAGMLTFIIDGYVDGKRQRSISDTLEVKDAPIADDAGEPSNPTATPTEMLQAQIENIMDTIQEASTAGQNAKASETNAKDSENKAKEYAEEAEGHSTKAKNAVGKTPYIGANGNWFAWDSEVGDWYDTMVKAQAGSTVYVGENPPEDAEVWVDPSGEGTKLPVDMVEFSNGIKLVATDGKMLELRCIGSSSILYDGTNNWIEVDMADFALRTAFDEKENRIIETYATKEEVGNEISSIRFDLHNDIGIIAAVTDYIGDKVDIIQDDMVAIRDRVDNTEEKVDIIAENVTSIEGRLDYESHFRGYVSTNAKLESLVATPNDFAYSAESGTKWIFDGDAGEWQDSGVTVPDQLTPPSDSTPLMNGEASVGRETAYARGDHRHPTDNTRASVAELNALKTDIATALTRIIDIQESLIGGDA